MEILVCARIEIKDDKYFLDRIDVINRWQSFRKLDVSMIHHPFLTVSPKCFLDNYRGNSVEIVGDVVTFTIKRKRLKFVYKLNSYEDFVDVVDYYIKHIPDSVIKEVKEAVLDYMQTYCPELL